jgi:RNA polymerase primary sigma factor
MESRILRWRFGLDDEEELTLKEIGDKYNLSRERIRQLQEQALEKIRRQIHE